MTTLGDILDYEALVRMQIAKRINVQTHPTLPLRIFNYSNMAQFTGEWTHEERVCRGLIVDEDDNVIARGPSKFFNYGQPGAPEVALDDKVRVTRKEDGSLGIGYVYDGFYGVATRGSFASDQALHASDMLSQLDKGRIRLNSERGLTSIYEIVYPENRIVLNYGDLDKLIKLGNVDNESGLITGRNMGIFVDDHGYKYDGITFAEAIALPIPDDQEGYVLDIVGENYQTIGHLKLKGDRYKELHGAIFGLSERKIWESIGRGEDMVEFVAALPDELQPWAQGVVARIHGDTERWKLRIFGANQNIERHFGVENLRDVPRGEVARYIQQDRIFKDISGPLFSLLDNKDEAIAEWIHKKLRPEHKLFRVDNQDVN